MEMSILRAENQLPPLCLAHSSVATQSDPIHPESDTSAGESRVRITMAVGLVIIGIGCVITRYYHPFFSDPSRGWLSSQLHRMVGRWELGPMLFYPIALMFIFVLEKWIPAV